MDAGFALLAVLALVLANGFFVAAEFSLVTVRKTRIDQLIAEGSRLAKPVRRALNNPTAFIAATQVGITMASLGLGWVGEPAIAAIILPAFAALPPAISLATAHTIAAAIAFIVITALHIVLGELVPKTIALQRAEQTAVRSDASLTEVVDLVARGRHTSLPVYREEVDDVIGIVLVTDLVRALASPPPNFNIGALAREALTVPETMKADDVLK